MTGEALIRLGAFAAVLVAMAVWERLAPAHAPVDGRGVRWRANLGLVALDSLIVRIAMPVGAVGMAVLAREGAFGLFNVVDAPPALEFILAVVTLDFAIYLQHVFFHAVPLLWSLHGVHHSDPDVDATTGVRFHPVEIVLSMALKLAVVAALGPAPVAVMAFEIALNAGSVFNHANVRLPERIDRVLRWVVVTPAMHRVHHSTERDETDSNFGFNLPWWDRLCGTYRQAPRAGDAGVRLGLESYRDARQLGLLRLIALPLSLRSEPAAREMDPVRPRRT